MELREQDARYRFEMRAVKSLMRESFLACACASFVNAFATKNPRYAPLTATFSEKIINSFFPTLAIQFLHSKIKVASYPAAKDAVTNTSISWRTPFWTRTLLP